MLLTSRPARSPLTHLERVKFTPSYDPNLSICSRSPVNIVNFHLPPSDADSPVPSTPKTIPSQPKNPYDLYGPMGTGPLRAVTNAPKQPPAELGRRLTVANLSTPGGKLVGFPRTLQQKLAVPKRVRFHGTEIIIPPIRDSPISPTTPAMNNPLDIPEQASLPLILIVSCENAGPTSSEHTSVPPALDRETSEPEEFPDSPSVYSPTPPNSSVISTSNSSERLPPQLDSSFTDIGHNHSAGRSSDEDSSNGQPTNERPRTKVESTSTPEDVSYGEPYRLIC
jgi:hypothetical protein